MSIVNVLKKSSMVAVGAAGMTLGTLGVANAAAIDFTTPTNNSTNGNWSLGWEFTTNSKIEVTMLGFYDDLKNDLTESHEVGIFDENGNLLVSGTVRPGDTLDGWFRYTSVAPTVLAAGKTFFISAVTGNENYTYDPLGFSVDAAINFVSDRYISSSTLQLPTNSAGGGTKGWFGANFQYESVPEPASVLGLLAIGALGAGSVLKKGKSVE